MSSNLESEIKTYNNLFKQHDNALNKLNQLFKTISINGIQFSEKCKKSLENFFIELKHENSSATHIICLTNFYNGLKTYFDKMKLIFQSIDKQCAEKVNEFSTNFKNKNNESITNMQKLNVKLKEEASNLEKVKFEYFNANKVADQDYLRTKKETKKEEEIKKNKEIYEKTCNNLESMKEKYFLKINNYNKNLAVLEKNYLTYVNNIYSEQEKKITFYHEVLNNLKLQINYISEANKDVLNIIEKINKSQNIQRDVGLFKDDYNFLDENKKRFIPENFLDYEVFRKNTSEKKNNINKEKDKKNNSTWVFNKNDETEEKTNNLVKTIFNGTEKINDDDISFLMNYVENSKENKDTFIEILKYNYSQNNQFLKINNIHNFNVLANLIQLIIDSYSNDIESHLDKFFFMINISENTLFCDTEFISIKNYLCQKTCSLNLLKQKNFWVKLIDTKIKEVTEGKTRAEILKKEKGGNFRGNVNEKSTTSLSNYLNFFSSGNKKVENEIVFGQKYKDNLPICCIEVIEKYIRHFSNFNISKERSIEIVNEIYDKYKFQKIYLDYFISEINSNNDLNKKVFINDIFEITKIKYDYNKYSFLLNEMKQIKSPKLIVLISTLQYLDTADYFNIMLLNKEYYNSIKKIVYKIMLLKKSEISIEKKILIWKKILNYSENKAKYKYEDIKNEIINKSPTKKGRDVIDLDVVRTSFEKDKELNQQKLRNILKSAVHVTPEIIYNQGMNYVGAFLLNITNNEEDAFYLFLGLLTSTKYGELFKNDLAQLKKFFYIFERIISIYIPELYNFLLSNNIKVNYFISSWFITLFTNAYQDLKVKDDPKIILKIFDLFFLNSWKSIIITSISLLKVYEPKIMLFSAEEILRFLINDIIKESYFENDNYERFMYITYNFKIDDKLIENIEKELDIKSKLPNLEKILGSQII